jgi:hypothetical protein
MVLPRELLIAQMVHVQGLPNEAPMALPMTIVLLSMLKQMQSSGQTPRYEQMEH